MTMIKVNSNDYMGRYKCEKIKQTNKLTLISIFEKSKEYSKLQPFDKFLNKKEAGIFEVTEKVINMMAFLLY